MTQVRVEIEGGADEVVRVLWHLGSAGRCRWAPRKAAVILANVSALPAGSHISPLANQRGHP